jgi:hypothetical protein
MNFDSYPDDTSGFTGFSDPASFDLGGVDNFVPNEPVGFEDPVLPDIAYQGDTTQPGNVSKNPNVSPADVTRMINADSTGLLKKLFVDDKGNLNLKTLAGIGGGLLGALGANTPNIKKVGYQGGIPKYDAVRNMVNAPPTRAQGYRPGQGGINYGGDVSFVPRGTGASMAATQPSQDINRAPAGVAGQPGLAIGAASGIGGLLTGNSLAGLAGPGSADYIDRKNLLPPPPMSLAEERRIQDMRSKNFPIDSFLNPQRPATAQPISRGDPFYQSPEYKAFQNDPSNMTGTMDMYNSPYFGSVSSGSVGRAMDKAYEKYKNIAPQQNQQIPAMFDSFSADENRFAHGGLMGLASGRYLQGETDGMADKIPAKIGQDQPAALSHGEFVIPADVVSHLGNGNSDAGAKKLYSMMDKIRTARTGTKKQGKEINPDKFMPGGNVQGYAEGGSADDYFSVLEERDLSNPRYREYLARQQSLEGVYPETFAAPIARGLGSLAKTARGMFAPAQKASTAFIENGPGLILKNPIGAPVPELTAADIERFLKAARSPQHAAKQKKHFAEQLPRVIDQNLLKTSPRNVFNAISEAQQTRDLMDERQQPNRMAGGGEVKHFVLGGATGSAVSGLGTAASAGVTGSETTPNTFAGEYIGDMLGKGQALANAPYQQYMGPLTAGESGLQSKVFGGLQNTNFPGSFGQSFSSTGAYAPPQMNMGAYNTQPIGTGPQPGMMLNQGSNGFGDFGSMQATTGLQNVGPAQPQTYDNYLKDIGDLSVLPQTREQFDTEQKQLGQQRQQGMDMLGRGNMSEIMAGLGGQPGQMPPSGMGGLAGLAGRMPQPQQPQGIASQYMNPYLQSVLDPQMAELRRQNDITNMASNARMTSAGAFGGGRQAILNAENNRNLMQEMNKTVGQGYASAYDKAQNQFNIEQGQGLSLANLMANQGTTQRGIEAEGIAADKAAFEAARENPYKMLQFQQSMLQGMPISATNIETTTPSKLQEVLSGIGGGIKMLGNKPEDISLKSVTDLLNTLGLGK